MTETHAAEDRRRCVLVPTDTGRETLDAVTDRRRELLADIGAGWPDDDVDALITLLDRFATDLERPVVA